MIAATTLWVLKLISTIDRPSLWLDDLWVAVLVDGADVKDLADLKPPVPPSFVLLQQLLDFSPSDADLFILPIAAGAATVVVTSVIAGSYFRNAWIACGCTFLLISNPLLFTYAARVKQYSVDSLATGLVVLAVLAFCEKRSKTRAITLIITSGAALLLSFQAVLIVTIGAVVTLLWAPPHDRVCRQHVVSAVLLVLAAGYFFIVARHFSNVRIAEYWHDYYLPWHRPFAIPEFLAKQLITLVTQNFAHGSGFFALLALLGLGCSLQKGRERLIAIIAILYFSALIALSALKEYPLGAGRTDIFGIPLIVLTVAAAVSVLGRLNSILPKAFAFVAACFAAFELYSSEAPYPSGGDKATVELASVMSAPNDALVIYPFANWAVSHYGPWAFKLTKADSTNNYYSVSRRPNTITLRERVEGVFFRDDPRVLSNQIDAFLINRHNRVLFLVTSGRFLSEEAVATTFRDNGYHRTDRIVTGRHSHLSIFVRDDEARM